MVFCKNINYGVYKGLEEREVMRVETAEVNYYAKKIGLYPLSKGESFTGILNKGRTRKDCLLAKSPWL